MPELPEVETVVRQLAPVVSALRIRDVELLDPRLEGLPTARLCGRRIERVFRQGKQIVLELDCELHRDGRRRRAAVATRAADRGASSGGTPLWLTAHLRMTGRLLWQPPGVAARERSADLLRHLRARLRLERGAILFVDPRRFGTLELRDTLQAPAGVDPTGEGFTVEALAGLLRGVGQPIKPWLLRQDRLVGLGNIYACEILYAARIDPRRACGALTRPRIARLHRATSEVLHAAIDNCGTTFSDFQDAHGVTGSYQRYLRVYGREGEPCSSCGVRVRRLVQQQRSTFFCPRCQRR